MKSTGIRTVVVLMLSTLCLETAHCADPASPKFDVEVSKQESIYYSEGERVPEGYTVDRSLSAYIDALSAGFNRALASLGATDRWLDIGAGKGQAILDYYGSDYDRRYLEGKRRGKKAQAVAISIEDRRTPLWQENVASLGGDQIRYLFNRRLREYSLKELGKFQVITDIGGFSYAVDLSLFMEKVMGFLELNGSFYTVLQDVHGEDGTNRPYYAKAPFLTELASADGSDVKVCSWLKRITCAEVTCELKTHWKPPIEAYRVRKVCNDVTVPALAQIKYEAGTPPERRYQLKN